MANWWQYPNGTNALSGLDIWDEENLRWAANPDNPAVLDRDTIAHLLRTIPSARLGFNTIYPTMSQEEQARLDEIATSAKFMIRDPKDVEDAFQRKMNSQGIYTTGPRGGKR